MLSRECRFWKHRHALAASAEALIFDTRETPFSDMRRGRITPTTLNHVLIE